MGYSHAERTFDIAQNDYQYTKDALSFIKQFYSSWPKLASNPLYIAGVSYGGMYAPYLAWAIHQHNEEVIMGNTNETLKINLKGFIVANGATEWSTDPFISTVDAAYHFNLFDPQIYKRYKAQNCSYYWQEIKPNLPGDCTLLL